ncbi:unnamed protein product (macronuclear) [Paramecium tetraurelia]|uniref:GOLD domain-containing protein n=1 Tax=Paramecium tetraurelia TaxID=5888 RepID=A0CQL6_PARTE|nr:uncharacterized protein GSPATT00009431001 [Paramecium tetraurelia]CAK73083.1 unnamed protein product [Paramecium tetraurelia]|eukprot:XP_001440480.1 hypothetical protein (macronuclear) [Paramecium tetraurelia strain d4-2]
MILELILLFTGVQSITLKFKVPPGQQQCIKDSVSQNTLIYGNFDTTSSLYTFTLSVINQQDQESVIIEYSIDINQQFHYVMEESGEISMCFEADDYADVITFNLFYESGTQLSSILGAEVYDQDLLAKKQHVLNLNETLETMEQLQQDISREQLLIVDRENKRKHSFTDIQTKIIGFAGITFGLLIIVATCQVIYVKRFVIYKKLA